VCSEYKGGQVAEMLVKNKKYPHSCNFTLIPMHYFVFSGDPKTKVKNFEMLFSDRQPVR
jgi:hypothetical protein